MVLGTECSDRRPLVFHPAVVAAATALCGSLVPVAPWSASTIGLLWIVLSLRSDKPSRLAIFVTFLSLLFALSSFRAHQKIERYRAHYFQIASEIDGPKRCAFTARVESSPTLRSGREGEKDVLLWTAVSERLDCEGKGIEGPLALRLYSAPTPLVRGDLVECVAQLAPLRLFRNAPLPDPWPGAARRAALLSGRALNVEKTSQRVSLSSWIDEKRASVRTRIQQTYSERTESLGRALVLGENDLAYDEAEAFRNSGLLHLLAVSGTHLVIAVVALVSLLRAFLVRFSFIATRFDVSRIAASFGALMSLFYADFSGGSGSAFRASFMLCVVFGGRAIGIRLGGAFALGASLLIGIAIDPLVGSDYSFLLSALATAGLIGLGQPLSLLYEKSRFNHPLIRPIVLSLIATVSSTIMCAPVLAMMDDQMTCAALIANVVAAPLGEVIALPACLLHSIVVVFPALEAGLATLGSGALYGVRAIALASAALDQAQFHVPYPGHSEVALGVAACLCLFRFASNLRQRGILALGALPMVVATQSIFALADNKPSGSLSITALDVGQGDALLIEFPDGKVGLMDGGGFATNIPDTGTRVVLPYLRARGIKRIDVTILSHAHPDHMLGLLSVLEQLETKELWIPALPQRNESGLEQLVLLAKRSGARVVSAPELCKLSRDRPFSYGDVGVEFLSPCERFSPPLGKNDASLVLRLTHKRRRALLTGDIERRAEAHLASSRARFLETDFLKVAHHGSHTSSTKAFLLAATPQFAFISSGIRNRYDHPRPGTLARLNDLGVRTYRTDQMGSLTYSTDGENQQVFISSPRSAKISP